jgi:hypothetical protein
MVEPRSQPDCEAHVNESIVPHGRAAPVHPAEQSSFEQQSPPARQTAPQQIPPGHAAMSPAGLWAQAPARQVSIVQGFESSQ